MGGDEESVEGSGGGVEGMGRVLWAGSTFSRFRSPCSITAVGISSISLFELSIYSH